MRLGGEDTDILLLLLLLRFAKMEIGRNVAAVLLRRDLQEVGKERDMPVMVDHEAISQDSCDPILFTFLFLFSERALAKASTIRC